MTSLHIHNTLSREKEPFTPLDPNHIRMYVCGPTVYDFAHLGNARPVVVFDTLYRLLKRHYPRVTYVRNITDVDDKIMAKAKETSEPIDAITQRTTKAYHDDMAALNALPPDIEPRATQHIPQMVAMIGKLIAQGHAYAAEGHVLFNVPSMKDYGQLSRRSRDELIAGARVDVAPYKKDPADFVLWKPSAVEQPGWDSPWGRGRPGWHIECSAMAEAHLGATFDIHGGGLDLIFPHHENEIAQSRCAHDGAPLAKVWMHNGFLNIDSDKMSKSLGNFFTVRELLAKFPGEAIRLTLLSAHYRKPLDFSLDAVEKAKAKLDRWYGALRAASEVENISEKLPLPFEQALLDDLNTHEAITYIDELVKLLNSAELPAARMSHKAQILAAGKAFGLLEKNPEEWFTKKQTILLEGGMSLRVTGKAQLTIAPSGTEGESKIVPPLDWLPQSGGTANQPLDQNKQHFHRQHSGSYEVQPIGIEEAEIEAQIAARLAARKAKNFAEADRIRDVLAAEGIVLEDGAGGTTWKRG